MSRDLEDRVSRLERERHQVPALQEEVQNARRKASDVEDRCRNLQSQLEDTARQFQNALDESTRAIEELTLQFQQLQEQRNT